MSTRTATSTRSASGARPRQPEDAPAGGSQRPAPGPGGRGRTIYEPAPLDTGPLDTGPLDTGPLDTGPLDTGPLDTGPLMWAGLAACTGARFTARPPARKAAEPAVRPAPPAVPSPTNPAASRSRAAIAPAEDLVHRRAHAALGSHHPPDDHDHRRHGPEVPAHPQDGRADLLVRERRQGDAGDVGRRPDIPNPVRRCSASSRCRSSRRWCRSSAPAPLGQQGHPAPERRRRDGTPQPEQHPGAEHGPVHQPDVHGLVLLGRGRMARAGATRSSPR